MGVVALLYSNKTMYFFRQDEQMFFILSQIVCFAYSPGLKIV